MTEYREYDLIGADLLYNNLTLVDGTPVGKRIVDTVLDNPKIDEVILFGPPGVGKTTISMLLGIELERTSGGEIGIDRLLHDDVAAKLVAELGCSFDAWTRDDWIRFNMDLVGAGERTVGHKVGKRIIKFRETIGVGRTAPRDRGVTALNIVAEKDRTERRKIFLGFVPDFLCQDRASRIRTECLKQEDSEVETFLLKNNIMPTGVLRSSFNRLRSAENRGRALKESIGRMAQKVHIDKINSEMDELGEEFFSPDTAMEILSFPEPPQLKFFAGVSGTSFTFRKIAYYLENRMRNELHLPEDTGFLVVNQFDPDKMISWFIDDTMRYTIA